MEKLKIAFIQLKASTDLDENTATGLKAVSEAKENGADIVLFPEMWSNGYCTPENLDELNAMAIPSDGDYIESFRNAARDNEIAIAVSLLEKTGSNPKNSVILIDRYGQIKYDYSKVHTCVFGAERNLLPGEDFYVTELDTEKGDVKVGSMICYDREFPESARILMLKGAELILVPNACPMEINRLSQLRGRAFENMLAIATCNYPDTVDDCNGHSTLFDGVAYSLDPDETDSRDTCVFEAPSSEGIFYGELDLEMLRSYRAVEIHGNCYRHPEKYSILLDSEVREPFIRSK